MKILSATFTLLVVSVAAASGDETPRTQSSLNPSPFLLERNSANGNGDGNTHNNAPSKVIATLRF